MEFKEMQERLEKELPAKRFHHTLAVSETAVKLARRYGVDEKKAAIAGLLHDSGRQIPTKEFIAKPRNWASLWMRWKRTSPS